MLWTSLVALAALASPVFGAGVTFTSPSAGSTQTGGGSIKITWKDSGSGVALSDLTSYQIFLCAGDNDNYETLLTIVGSTGAVPFSSTGDAATGSISATLGGTTKNAYFLKMVSAATAGGTVTNFSPRFTLSGMTGQFSAAVVTQLKSVTGTDGPDTIDGTGSAASSSSADDGAYGVFYTAQTGLTRYAPMQKIPPTKITQKSASMQYPTSSYTVATTFWAPPSIQTTITKSQTFSVESRANTAAAAPMPSDDMAKFLARWKD